MPLTDKGCFDRVLPLEMQQPLAGGMIVLGIDPTRAAFQSAKLWPNGSTIRIRFIGETAAQQALVKQHAMQWTAPANLKCEFGTAPNSFYAL